ncbi:MAG: glycosyltransferase family 2 protein [Acidobacteria bacterium]|nr:glycosyltransferase family 2 protein [Acidobacteriota bacterium]MCB9398572.1 glycosyltransferase family 2 protein [Acidobacteriota bacterium]
MTKPATVSVVVVNWNGLHHLETCLNALTHQTLQPLEIFVVDNGSNDGSVAFLEQLANPLIKPIFLNENRGFAGGNNVAIQRCQGDWIALINNDTRADLDWIRAASTHFDTESLGMVASRVLRFDDPKTIDKVGHLMFPDGLNRGRATGLPDGPPFDQPSETLWPDGCAGFYRRSMLEQIGLLDEDFYLYGEDAELGMRARWAGYGCVYEPKSWILHKHSATLGRFNPRKLYFVERNRIFLLVKTFPMSWLLLSPWHSLRRYVMNVVSMGSGRGAAAQFRQNQSAFALALTLLKALLHGVMGAPKMLQKRRQILRSINGRDMKELLRRHRISAREISLQD